VVVAGKALRGGVGRLGELMGEVWTRGRLDHRERMVAHLRGVVAGHEAGLVSSGHSYGESLVAAQLTMAGWVSEMLHGVTAYRVAQALLRRI